MDTAQLPEKFKRPSDENQTAKPSDVSQASRQIIRGTGGMESKLNDLPEALQGMYYLP